MSFPTYALTHALSGLTIARVARLDGWWAKGRGVIGYPEMPPGEGVWLPGVSAVHSFFVRFPLDLLFLDLQLRTLHALPHFPAWRPLAWAPGARHTLELGAGTFAGFGAAVHGGDTWLLRPEGENVI